MYKFPHAVEGEVNERVATGMILKSLSSPLYVIDLSNMPPLIHIKSKDHYLPVITIVALIFNLVSWNSKLKACFSYILCHL